VKVLVVDTGSSSVKLRVVDESDQVVSSIDLGPPDDSLTDHIRDFVDLAGAVDAVGHRVVHGGPKFVVATVIDRYVRDALESLRDLAPLHNPSALAGIDAAQHLLPDLPQVACFDTAFHACLPQVATTYAIPPQWVTRWGLRRYGFHGISCAWATRQAPKLLHRPVSPLRLVICHLGSGASATAVNAGRSTDTTMGFTPLEGLVMATRCGDLDPGALLFALDRGLSTTDANRALEHLSGLMGISGGPDGDMRRLLADRLSGNEAAALAIAVYVHRLQAKIAAMTAATSGVDALVFTGGVGERSAVIRTETCSGLGWLGVSIDEHANSGVSETDADISTRGAGVATLVIHAREDLQIAHECRQLLGPPINPAPPSR
jgi:acetate kinase